MLEWVDPPKLDALPLSLVLLPPTWVTELLVAR